MENNEKEQINPDLLADDSDQELTNNIDGTKMIPENEMMNDDGTDNLEVGNLRDIERDNKSNANGTTDPTQMKSKIDALDLPYDVPNDETPPMNDMPKNYEKFSNQDDHVLSKDE